MIFCYDGSVLEAEFLRRGYQLLLTFEGVQFWEVPSKMEPLMVRVPDENGHLIADLVDDVVHSLGEPPLQIPNFMCP